MNTPVNFKIYNPLLDLESGTGGGGSITPGSVTGGPGGSIAPGTITNFNIAAGTITGGPGGNIAAGTVTGGPGGNIAPGTITSIDLAPGTAAANINSGPAGAINGSQVSNADNTHFGVIEFDPTGDLVQTAAGSGIAVLKAGAAAANINAGPAGSINSSQIAGGPFLSAAPGSVTGGPGGNIAPGTVTGGPGGDLAAGTVTSTNLAAGAAAANINAGPAGAITGSQVSKADNTNFGVIEFDPTGDLVQTAAGSGIALLKAGAAATNINAGPAGAITGTQVSKADNTNFGVIEFDPTGDLVQTAVGSGIAVLKAGAAAANINAGPAGAINQSQIAGGPFQAKQPAAVPGDIAIFGAGANAAQTVDSGYSVSDATGPSPSILWSSQQIVTTEQMAFGGFKNSNAIVQLPIVAGATVRNFSNGFSNVGPVTWTGADGVTITMAGTGVVTITSTLPYITYYKSTFLGVGVSNSTNGANPCLLNMSLFNETTATVVSQTQSLKALPTAAVVGQFNNTAFLMNYVSVPASGTLSLSIHVSNPSATDNMLLDSVNDVCQWTIDRIG